MALLLNNKLRTKLFRSSAKCYNFLNLISLALKLVHDLTGFALPRAVLSRINSVSAQHANTDAT